MDLITFIRRLWERTSFTHKVLFAVSIFGVIFTILTILYYSTSPYYQTLLLIGISITTLPYGISMYIRYKSYKEMEVYLPDFLRDVAENYRSGMPLPKAFENASKGSYGVLGKEMRKISAQISWGVPLEEALERFSKKVRSKLIKQAITIILESYRSGGDIADILETVSSDIRALKMIERERTSKLKVYLISIYAIFFIFLGIMLVLSKTFIPEVPQLNKAAELLGGKPSPLSVDEYLTYIFHLSLIEAFFAGIIAGQMGEGSSIAGLKHSLALIIITILAFQIILAPERFEVVLAKDIGRISYGAPFQTTPTAFTLYYSTSTKALADEVKKVAKRYHLKHLENADPSFFTFEEAACGPCQKGDISVMHDRIIVKRPAKIKYTISYMPPNNYTIKISG